MKYSEIQNRSLPRFSGIKTFFRLPHEKPDKSTSKTLICGIPFDGGATYRPGARMAPARIREISSLGRGYHAHYNRDVFKLLKPVDIGDIPTNPLSLQKSYQLIEEEMLSLSKNERKILSVGGDHSITLPVLRALSKRYGPLNLIHFDAHFDTYPPAYGEEYHHGTFVRHAVLENCLKRVIQIGIRGPFTSKSDQEFVQKQGIEVWTVDDIKQKGLLAFSKMGKLKGPSYLSFDVDCMDPAYAPGTGTPMPGGLSSYEVQAILRQLQFENLVGGDLVEVSPAYDSSDITSLVAVSILLEIFNLLL